MKRSDAFSQRYQIRSACARCHRLKSKCVYENPDFVLCKRCFELGIKCSPDEDPTAKTAKKRAVAKPSRLARLLHEVERELLALRQKGDDSALAPMGQATAGLHDLAQIQRLLSLVVAHGDALLSVSSVLPHDSRQRYAFFLTRMRPLYPILAIPERLSDYDLCLRECPELLMACVYASTIHHVTGKRQRKPESPLKAYLDRALAQLVFVDASNFSCHLVSALMVLSLWSVPAEKPGHFKSQMDLLVAYSIAICIDPGPDLHIDVLRLFISVFCCCGLLSFSLSRFRFVLWLRRHHLAVRLLEKTAEASDLYLCGYLQVIVEGLRLMDFLNSVSLLANSVASEKELAEALPAFHETVQIPVVLNRVSESRESLQLLIPPFTNSERLSEYAPNLVLLVSFHQIMTMAYEHALGLCIFHVQVSQIQKTEVDLSPELCSLIQSISDSCGVVLECFFHVADKGHLPEFPTLMYYRALSALMALVRVCILAKSDVFKSHVNNDVILFDLAVLFRRVANAIVPCNLPVHERFTIILERIESWVQAIENDTVSVKNSLPKGQEVESLKTPAEETVLCADLKVDYDVVSDAAIQGIFKELEDDIERFLNPFSDNPFRTDELFFEP